MFYFVDFSENIRASVNFDTLNPRSKDWLLEYAQCANCAENIKDSEPCCDCSKDSIVTINGAYKNDFRDIFAKERRYQENLRRSEIRKTRVQKAEGIYKPEDVKAIYELQEGRCYYCKVLLANDKKIKYFEIEHIVPLSDGGTNWPSNISLACKKCNQKKGGKSLNEFWPIARKMYGSIVISASQKENRKHLPFKRKLAQVRKSELANLYIFENSPFWKIQKIMQRENADLTNIENSEFRMAFFDLLDLFMDKTARNIFGKTKSQLNKSQKFSLLLAQFILIESIHDFLEEEYGEWEDFKRRFDYGELCNDAADYFPAQDLQRSYYSNGNDPLYYFASDETEKEIPEFLEFSESVLRYLESPEKNDFSSIQNAFVKIHEKYGDIRAIRKSL